MNLKDYSSPIIMGAVSLVLSILFSDKISPILAENSLATELFTFSSLLFGLILTSYSMLFGLIPAMRKDFRKSDTIKDINFYFRSCLIFLLVSIIISLVYMFSPAYWIFIIIITLIGTDIGFFAYIIFLVNDIFEFANQESD